MKLQMLRPVKQILLGENLLGCLNPTKWERSSSYRRCSCSGCGDIWGYLSASKIINQKCKKRKTSKSLAQEMEQRGCGSFSNLLWKKQMMLFTSITMQITWIEFVCKVYYQKNAVKESGGLHAAGHRDGVEWAMWVNEKLQMQFPKLPVFPSRVPIREPQEERPCGWSSGIIYFLF